jgi:hypothetical protein
MLTLYCIPLTSPGTLRDRILPIYQTNMLDQYLPREILDQIVSLVSRIEVN